MTVVPCSYSLRFKSARSACYSALEERHRVDD